MNSNEYLKIIFGHVSNLRDKIVRDANKENYCSDFDLGKMCAYLDIIYFLKALQQSIKEGGKE